jgi:hypothetical protein
MHVLKDWQDLIDALKAQSWLVERTQDNHWRALDPTGEHIVVISASREPRAKLNAIADLRRRGFIWPAPEPAANPLDTVAKLDTCPACGERTFDTSVGRCTAMCVARQAATAEPPLPVFEIRRLYGQGHKLAVIARRCSLVAHNAGHVQVRAAADRIRNLLKREGIYRAKYTKRRKGMATARQRRVLSVALTLGDQFTEEALTLHAWAVGRPPNGGAHRVLRTLRKAGLVRCVRKDVGATPADIVWELTASGRTIADAEWHLKAKAEPASQLALPEVFDAPRRRRVKESSPGVPTHPVQPPPLPPSHFEQHPLGSPPFQFPPPFAPPAPPALSAIDYELNVLRLISDLDEQAQRRVASWLNSHLTGKGNRS